MDIVNEYNKLGFLAPIIVDICDNLEGTTRCKQKFKFHLKQANLEAQKALAKHYNLYENHGTVKQDEADISTQDIYNLTAKAYDFLLSKKPHEIASIASLVQRLEKEGQDYTQVLIPFDPLK